MFIIAAPLWIWVLTIVTPIIRGTDFQKIISSEVREKAPIIKDVNLDNFAWKVPLNKQLKFTVADPDNNLDSDSIEVLIITPNFWHYDIFRMYENEDLQISKLRGSEVEVVLVPREPLPYGNTVIWLLRADDQLDYRTQEILYTTAADDYLSLMFSIPFYIVVFAFFLVAIFKINIRLNPWGRVYNSVTHEPVQGALIRVFDGQGALVKTLVTDVNGMFQLRLPKGTYTLNISSSGYQFPSKKAASAKDMQEGMVYYGGEINLAKEKRSLSIKIPLDPISEESKDSGNAITVVKNSTISTVLTLSPLMLLILAFGYNFMVWDLSFNVEGVYRLVLAVFLLIMQLYFRYLGNRVGKVVDKENKPIKNLELGLYEVDFDTQVNSTQTDEEGKFIFFAKSRDYYIQVVSPEYKVASEDGRFYVKRRGDENMIITPKIVVERKM